MRNSDRAIAVTLRLFGAIDLTSLATAAMPFIWMQDLNERLGFGALPATPTVEYLARQTCVWYAVHAATWLYLSTDVPRYRPMIRFIAWLGLALSAALLAINITSGLPHWWTLTQLLAGSLGSALLLITLRHASSPPAAQAMVPSSDSPLLEEQGQG